MKKQFLVLFLCSLGYIISLLSRASPAVLADYMVADLGFTATNLGLVSASTMLSYGIMQLPAGMLADSFGPRKILVVFMSIAGLSTIAFALAQSPTQVVIARFFIGIGVSLSVVSITMVSLWFSPQTFARANSILCAASEFGTVLSASPLVIIVAYLTWRGSMLSLGIIMLIMVFCWYFLVPNEAPFQAKNKNPRTLKSSLEGLKVIIKTASFWPLCLWQMISIGSVYMMINLWFIPYLCNTAKYSVLEASYIITIASIILIGIQVAVGFLSDMVFKSRKKVLIGLSFMFLLSSFLLVFGVGSMGFWLNLLCASMLIGTVAGSNICGTMVKELFPSTLTGTALGCFNMFYPIWTAITQMLFGFILSFSLDKGFDTLIAYRFATSTVLFCAVIALVLSFLSKDTYTLSH